MLPDKNLERERELCGGVFLFLQTNDAQNDNFYPFVHLLPTNRLYIFANRDSILYNWEQHITLKRFPTIPGGPRNYPSAGSSVMLPLSAADDWATAEILICGGSEFGAFMDPRARLPASQTCGRILPLAANPEWAMENMPMRRNMGDMILLPTRQVEDEQTPVSFFWLAMYSQKYILII
jgi:hypothetical protein